MMKQNTNHVHNKEQIYSAENFREVCDVLAQHDPDLNFIIENYGYPPMWARKNTFETLVHIILEQQVSLASALAALNKLKHKIIKITPENILGLSDEEMRECYVSRQKNGYIKGLANAIVHGKINLKKFSEMSNDEVRKTLISLKGIGNWTVDVYLMFTLQRADIFPVGDLAAVNTLKRLKKLPPKTTKEEILKISEKWKPFRTVASMMLWHYYLSNSAKKN